jgi:hypothetical protein
MWTNGARNAAYPGNPNGSLGTWRASPMPPGTFWVSCPTRNGTLPFQNAQWTRQKLTKEGVGLQLFKNAVRYAAQVN